MALDEEITMCEQVGDFGLQTLSLARQRALMLGWAPTPPIGLLGSQGFADMGNGVQDGFAQIHKHMKLTHLVRHFTENFPNSSRIQG